MEKAEKEKIDLELQLDPVRLARMRVLKKKLEALQADIAKHAPISREAHIRSTLQRQEEAEIELLRS